MHEIKTRILVADPDPDVSTTLKLYFEAHGHEVKVEQDLYKLVGVARQWQPHTILVSTEFEDADPYLVCSDLLQDTLTAHIPIVLMLHLDDRMVRLEALEVGVDDIVTKPLDIEELRLRVEALIRFSTVRIGA
ncbi:MAG: response regulator [Chloroflexi bacterium]|nr:MAG: response regulator [Chloroflexota bacterium]